MNNAYWKKNHYWTDQNVWLSTIYQKGNHGTKSSSQLQLKFKNSFMLSAGMASSYAQLPMSASFPSINSDGLGSSKKKQRPPRQLLPTTRKEAA